MLPLQAAWSVRHGNAWAAAALGAVELAGRALRGRQRTNQQTELRET
jgi:hypothetical protein